MIEAVVADLGSVICYFKSGMPLLLQIGAELLKVGTAITNRGNHYKSVPANTTWTLLSEIHIGCIPKRIKRKYIYSR